MNTRISLSALSKAGLTIEMALLALLALLPFREKQKSFVIVQRNQSSEFHSTSFS